MNMHLETRSALPLETRDEGDVDPLIAATAAVEELRQAAEAERTRAAEAATTHANEVRALNTRLAGLETRLNRPGTAERTDEAPIEVRAFESFVRRGREVLGADEIRALRVSDTTQGGYLAPEQFEATILRGLVEISPVRAAARVTQTSAASVITPVRTGRINAKWVGETETREGSQPTYGQQEIVINEMAVWTDVSNQLLEDAAVNIESELSFDFVEEFGRLEGEAFVNGDGVKKPVGLMADPAVPVSLNGHATNLSADALVKLPYDLNPYYRNRGVWMLNGKSIAAIRLMKDSAGRFLWQESLAEGQPPTLLGRPVIEAVGMSDVAANAFPILFGDIGSAYRIIDRVGLSVLRDPFTQALSGITRFHARKRVGAGVVRAEAVRKLKMATA